MTGEARSGGGGGLPAEGLTGAQAVVTAPHQSRLLGWILVVTGWPLRVVLVLLLLAQHLHRTLQAVGTVGVVLLVASFVLPVPLYFATAALRRRGRRHLAAARVAEELGGGPFALYLRTFSDDPERARLAPSLRAVVGDPARSLLTDEEQLAVAMRRFGLGPVVTVGRPRERLPYAGASRVYLPDDGWRETVVGLMDSAALVLVGLGPGEQLRWELAQAVRRVPPRRVVLLVPYDDAAYAALREDAEAGEVLPRPLPAAPPLGRRRRYRYGIRGAVRFDADWEAHFVPFETSYPHPGRRITYAFLTLFGDTFSDLGRGPGGRDH